MKYKVLNMSIVADAAEGIINDYASQGWEMVSMDLKNIERNPNLVRLVVFMKRHEESIKPDVD